MKNKLAVRVLGPAGEYINGVTDQEQGAISADMQAMAQGDFESVYTKPLKGKIRELIVGRHRISYFIIDDSLYFVRGFPKKTAKTPKAEIDYAEAVYKLLKK